MAHFDDSVLQTFPFFFFFSHCSPFVFRTLRKDEVSQFQGDQERGFNGTNVPNFFVNAVKRIFIILSG